MVKNFMFFIGLALLFIAGLAIPLSVVYGLYQWSVEDLEFKIALWSAAKVWCLAMIGIVPGIALFSIGSS